MLLPGDPDERPGYSQRYECTARGCENTVLLPEHPTEGPVEVRAPCEDHGSVRHIALGRIARTGRPLYASPPPSNSYKTETTTPSSSEVSD